MKPFRSREDRLPIDHVRPDVGDGRSLAIVQHTAATRRSTEFQEVQANAIVIGPEKVFGRNAGLARVVGDEPAQWVPGQTRYPGAGTSEPGQGNGGIQLRATDEQLQAAGLLQTPEVRRAEAN